MDWKTFNAEVIEDFRASGGKPGGPLEGVPTLILHTIGAKTGIERLSPMGYQPVGDGWAVFATNAGAPTHPAWYHNLVARPDELLIEIGTDTLPVRARTAEGDERETIWAKQVKLTPLLGEYRTFPRVIPVVILEPR